VAASWTTANREPFADIPLELLSIEDNSNASKGTEAWKPPRRARRCTNSKRQRPRNQNLYARGSEAGSLPSRTLEQ
jgi:hypothetical protein